MIASCGFLESELRHFSREEGVKIADSVEVKKLGAKEKQEERSAGSDSRSQEE